MKLRCNELFSRHPGHIAGDSTPTCCSSVLFQQGTAEAAPLYTNCARSGRRMLCVQRGGHLLHRYALSKRKYHGGKTSQKCYCATLHISHRSIGNSAFYALTCSFGAYKRVNVARHDLCSPRGIALGIIRIHSYSYSPPSKQLSMETPTALPD